MEKFKLTAEQIENYNQNGYLIIKNFISTDEVNKLYGIANNDDLLQKHAFDLNDQTGKKQN